MVTTTLEEQKCSHLREAQVTMCLLGVGQSHEQELLTSPMESLVKLVSTPVLEPPARFGVGFHPPLAALDHRGCLRRPCRLQDQDP